MMAYNKMNRNRIKLIYSFNDNNFKLPGFKIMHWVPVIFPPCRNSYFISKDVNPSFSDEIREKLLENFGYEVVSLYDTCGYNPLLLDIETYSLDRIREVTDSIRDQGDDVSPKFMSFTTSPESILKRFGEVLESENLSEKRQELLDTINENPIFLDILEYIVYNDYKKYKGSVFKEGDNTSDTEYLEAKKIVENNVNNTIIEIQNKDLQKLMRDVAKFHGYEKNKFVGKEKEFNSVVLDMEKLKKFICFAPIVIPPILAMIFLRFPLEMNLETMKKYVEDDLMKEDNIVDIYKLFGSSDEYVVKVWAKSISDLDKLLYEKFYVKGIRTGTKLVLKIWKKEGWLPTSEQRFPPSETKNLDGLDYKILSIMDNYAKTLSNMNKQGQEQEIKSVLGRASADQIITPDEVKNKLEKLKKEVIAKHGIKLECSEWIKTLIFIRAARGMKSELEKKINDFLLGVDDKRFARKFYHMTGDFDFIVPLDCMGPDTLRNRIKIFVSEANGMVNDIRIYFDLHKDYRDRMSMSEPKQTHRHFAYMSALLPNSENINELHKNSPRYVCYEYVYNERMGRPKTPPKINFDSIERYVTPTIELRSESVVHAFVRFRILDKTEFDRKLENLEKREEQIKKGITLRTYRPIHNANVVFCILTTSNFKSLFHFISEFDKHCISTLPSIIFSQKFFEPDIPPHLRCKPCVGESKKCRACEQYPIARDKSKIHTRNLGVNSIDDCKIAIVQIKQEKEDSEVDKGDVIEKLREAIDNESNIIIFPELTIPDAFINEIKKVMKEKCNEGKVSKRLFVVAGSRYKMESGYKYDVCPILYLNERCNIIVYDDNYRNYKSSKYDDEDFVTGNNGIWRYINTGFGNFAVINCIDFIAANKKILANIFQEGNRCDILIVIARNHPMVVYHTLAETTAREVNCAIAIANDGDTGYGGSRFYLPYKDNTLLAKKLEEETIPEGKEDIIYHTINSIELDKTRDIDSSYLSEKEKKQLNKKYFCGVASQHGPIHRKLWRKGK